MKIDLTCLAQEADHSCLPACIRMVLRHHGHEYSEAEICAACETTERGTGHEQGAMGIAKLGFKVIKLEDVPLDTLLKFIFQGTPVIVLVYVSLLPYAKKQGGLHAVLIAGVDDDYISFIDPARAEEIEIDLDTFLAAWDKRGRLGLVIEP